MSNAFPPNEPEQPAQPSGSDPTAPPAPPTPDTTVTAAAVPPAPDAQPVYPGALGAAPYTAAPTLADPNAPVAPSKKNGLGLASVILGAVAFLFAFIPGVNFFAIVVALVGVVLGAIGLAQKNKVKTLALVGTILSGVAAVLAVIMIVVYAAVFVKAVDDSLPKVDTATEAPAESDAAEEPAEPEEPAVPEVGTRDNPAALGTTITMTENGASTWEITPGASNLNAGEAVASTNQFNDPAPDGYQWATLPLHLTYIGEGSSTPGYDIQVKFVGADGKTYETYNELASGYIEGDLDSTTEMFTGASTDATVLILIPSADAEKGTWAISPLFGDEPYFFKAV
ncbi:DUF4190 domain-containing protein [Leifsonia sp. YIM 134122]|uniref:DUF4190 domain-containing protein n=1 Tax=Leifsonia stereocauli TaxID=3134136 RepID=A0ABU9W0I7_9MICO